MPAKGQGNLNNIRYVAVATGRSFKVHAQYPSIPTIPDSTLTALLKQIHGDDHKRTLTTSTDSKIHYKVADHVCYLCITEASSRARNAFELLDELENEYKKGAFDRSEADRIKLLRQKFDYFNDPVNDKYSMLSTRVDEVRDVMIDNIDKVLQRGDKLDNMVQATDDLMETGAKFQRTSRRAKSKMYCRFWIFLLLGLFVLLLLAGGGAVAVVAIVCGGLTNCGKSKKQ